MPTHSGCPHANLVELLAEAKERLKLVVAERDARTDLCGRGNRTDTEFRAALVKQREEEAILRDQAEVAPDWATDAANEDLFNEQLTVRFHANMLKMTNFSTRF
jgi:hypothetical protein